MLPVLRILEAAGDQTAMRQEVANLLGLDEPVAPEVIERACNDDHYASYLFRSVGHPELLSVVMAAASHPAPRLGEEASEPEAPQYMGPSNIELLKKASGAMLKWAGGGFQRLDPEVIERRWAACTACSYLREPPDRVLYKVTLSPRSDQRVCSACGCTASRKAGLPDEACPVEDTDRPGFTRWQEPLRRSPKGDGIAN